MSANQNKDNMTSRNIMKQMAAALQQHLRDANIKDVDENSVAKKLQEHLLANVIVFTRSSLACFFLIESDSLAKRNCLVAVALKIIL